MISWKTSAESNDGLRHTFCHFSARVKLRNVRISHGVDSASGAIELTLTVETNDVLPRQTDGLYIAGPDYSVFADVLQDRLEMPSRSFCPNTSFT